MKVYILLFITLIPVFTASRSEQEELPIGFTPWEWENRHLIYEYANETDPPPDPIRNIAEFERMQGVIIRYPLGISTNIVKEIAEDVIVYCLVTSALQSSAQITFTNAGVNMDNVEFVIGSTDSYWTRDYGPWWVVDGNRNVSIVDFTYNRPRPNDNQASFKMSEYLNTPYFATDLVHTGGNYMTDSYGISASSSLVYTENFISPSEVDSTMKTYYGVNSYHVVDDPNGDYIEHIDTWGKFLSQSKLLIRSVPEDHSQYDEIEAVVDYFSSQVNAFGDPYEIFRIYTPQDQPYANSLILNEKILVPIMNSSWDDEALSVYAEALPGYEILPFTGSWLSTDAIHCRIKGIPDLKMLQIFHNPIDDQGTPQLQYEVITIIDDLSDAGLIEDSLKVFWQTSSTGYYNSVSLSTTGNADEYRAFIPAPGESTEIHYYVQAADYSGRVETLPMAGYFAFTVSGLLAGDVTMDGEVNIFDVMAIVHYMLRISELSPEQIQIADMNNDHTVDIFDIVSIVDIIVSRRS